MKSLISAVMATAVFALSTAHATEDPAVAIAMVDKGAAFMKKNGKDALIAAINAKSPEFATGDTYLTMRAMDGTQLAHPTNPKLIGKNMVVLPDADGKLFRKEIIEGAQKTGKGWVDYRYNNPTTGQIEKKSTYYFKSGDVILEAGIYKGK